MRKVLLGVAVAALAVAALPTPIGALTVAPQPLAFSAQPSALPPGNDFVVRGYCQADSSKVTVRFLQQARPGKAQSVIATKSTNTTTDEYGVKSFSLTFRNTLVPSGGFSIDARLVATCAGYTADAPFVSTQLAYPRNRQAILTAQVSPRCDGCPPHLKGFDAFGNLANFNHAFKSKWTSIASLVNTPYDTGNDEVAPADRIYTSATLVSGPGMKVSVGSNAAYDSITDAFTGFTGGGSVAFGDLNGDGAREIVVSAGPGGGPHVKFFWTQKDNRPTTGLPFEDGGFFAYPAGFAGGARVAVGDVLGDDKPEIVTAPGPGGGPHVKIFDTEGRLLKEFFAYAPNMTGGVSISVGDVVPGGKKEIVTGAGPGGAPHVRTFSGDGTPIGNGFYAYAESFAGGVNVSVGDIDHQGGADIVTGAGPGGMPHVRWFTSPDGAFTTAGFYAYEDIPTGVLVAAESQ